MCFVCLTLLHLKCFFFFTDVDFLQFLMSLVDELVLLYPLKFCNSTPELSCDNLMLDILRSVSIKLPIYKVIFNKCIFFISTCDHSFVKSVYASERKWYVIFFIVMSLRYLLNHCFPMLCTDLTLNVLENWNFGWFGFFKLECRKLISIVGF